MTSGSLTRDKEPEEHPGRRDMTPFPGEDAVMMVSDGCPLSGGVIGLSQVPELSLTAVRDLGTQGL
jgi:hypothetical protein